MGQSTATDADVDALLGHVVDELVNQTAGTVGRDHLMGLAAGLRAETIAHGGEPFSPGLAARFAHTRLRAELVRDGLITKVKPEVLILSRDDTGRARAAAALMRHYAPGRLYVVCADLHPGGHVMDSIDQVLGQHGVRPTDAPTRCSTTMIGIADHLVVVGATGTIQPVQGQDRHVWSDIATTAGASDEDVTRVLAEIDRRVLRLVGDWLPGTHMPEPVFTQPALV